MIQRAWLIKKKKFLGVDYLDNYKGAENTSSDEFVKKAEDLSFLKCFSGEVEIDTYSNLHDRKGFKIYSNDLLKSDDNNVYLVCFESDVFFVKNLATREIISLEDFWLKEKGSEIIGNLHELEKFIK